MTGVRISRSVGGQQGRSCFALKECSYGVYQVLKNRAALQGARSDHRPHPLTVALAVLSTRALRDPSVDDHKADGLLGRIVSRIYSRSGDEREILFTIVPKTIRHRFDDPVFGQRPADPLHRG